MTETSTPVSDRARIAQLEEHMAVVRAKVARAEEAIAALTCAVVSNNQLLHHAAIRAAVADRPWWRTRRRQHDIITRGASDALQENRP